MSTTEQEREYEEGAAGTKIERAFPLPRREDIFGDAYEYLLAEFAEETKKKGGEFFTPRQVVRLLVNLVEPSNLCLVSSHNIAVRTTIMGTIDSFCCIKRHCTICCN